MPAGKVKWFSADKGFGFLSREDGADVFVHRDALPAGVTELKPGQRVEFGIVEGRRGDQALQVKVLDPLPSVTQASRRPADELVPIIEDLIGEVDVGQEASYELSTSDAVPAAYYIVIVQDSGADCEGLAGAWPIGFLRQ